MSTPIQIRDDLYERLKKTKEITSASFSDVIEAMIKQNDNLKEVMINQEGRFEGSRALTGITIQYRVILTPN